MNHTATDKYSGNADLILRAQSVDEEAALRATEELIANNMGLIRSIALKFRDRGCDMEDLIQIGTMGMLKAIKSFECERGNAFSTYAVPLIVGEIRRHFRDNGLIKVSRYYKKLGTELMRARNGILAADGREPGIEELAAMCAVSPEEAAVALDAMSPVASLSDHLYGEEGTTIESVVADTDNEIEKLSDKIALSQAISHMPDMWRKIVLLRYYRGFTQQQTADRLGLSQVKVSREEKKIIEFLRGELIG